MSGVREEIVLFEKDTLWVLLGNFKHRQTETLLNEKRIRQKNGRMGSNKIHCIGTPEEAQTLKTFN